jgi:uncharacterized membrane protein
MSGDSIFRSIVKALSWRVVATAITTGVALVVTHELVFAAAIGIADTTIKLGAYFAHERLWNRLSLGRAKPPEYII